jgi:branched-chain amino acid transport system ATP-binding protein
LLLEAEGLELVYGEVPACRDLTFNVGEGEIVTLIGANGAGKTTTLRAVAGAMRPRRGRIVFRGKDVTRLPAHERARAGIALVPEGRRVFAALTVRENLEMGGFKLRREPQRLAAQLERMLQMFPRLRERTAQAAGTLSGGEQQMLALGRALMSEPQLLCMDEPSLGLAPLIVEEIFRTIAELHRDGTTIFLVEQNAHMALKVAQRFFLMEQGRVSFSGDPGSLAKDELIRRAYLGSAR